MKTTAAANASPAQAWKIALDQRAHDMLPGDVWVAWVTISTAKPGFHGWETMALTCESREDAIAIACDYMRATRPYVRRVTIWRLDPNAHGLKDASHIARRKSDKLATIIARTAELAEIVTAA
jgi:hypothetical protein